MVAQLIPAIALIAGDFEEFCGKLLDHLLKTPLEHSGVNFVGQPVSSVLDSTSDDGTVVAQYSAEAGYFAGDMQKALGDIDKALVRRPMAKRILLISAEQTRPIVADNFKKKVLKQSRMKGRSLRILGSQTIATLIVRHLLLNDAAIEELSQYLPVLGQLREEFAKDLLFLDLPKRHRPRPEITREIRSRLAATHCLVLTGLGGSGKSVAAVAYGFEHANEYDLRIWLEPDEFKGAKALHALPLVRGGTRRNVATLLKRQRCLLVIDDPAVSVEAAELAARCGEGSHVLVTARTTVIGEYRIPALTQDEARDILNDSVMPHCPPGIFDTIWSTVAGHPLSYALMNAAVRTGEIWQNLALDCREVGQLSDSQVEPQANPQQRLADRLLSRYSAVLRKELSFFEWVGQPECDLGFLSRAILPAGIRKPNERALTTSGLPSMIRLHDVVYSSLSSIDWLSSQTSNRWNDVLGEYLAETSQLNDLSFRATALSLRNRLRKLIQAGDTRPAYVLALLAVTSHESSDSLGLDYPQYLVTQVAGRTDRIDPLWFRMIIETFEWQYLRVKLVGMKEAKAFAERGLTLFDDLERIPDLTSRQRSEICHHRGKALAWAGRRDKAVQEFEAVMASETPLDATRLQLLRAYKNAGLNDKAIQLGLEVIMAAEAHAGNVSPSVLVAVMQDIPWREEKARREILRPREDFIIRTILDNAAAGVEQAYSTLAAVARFWSQEAPEILQAVLEKIRKPDMARFEDDDTRHGFAEVLFEYGRGRGENGKPSLDTALALFEGAIRAKPYNEQRKAELLIEMGRAGEAEAILANRNELQTSGWIQRLMARALLVLGRPEEAINWIDRAFEDQACRSQFHQFREHRYEIRQALGDKGATDDLRAAIELAPEGAIRDRLKSRSSC
ncbi:hypothetical protein [Caballeronia sp. GAWG2-1]|uniref:hypothetical protein n=1 Tax=Caballeronia sp. GAWG2-1 TaxID=2921744 RepID=UPI0020283326|nr:hypothetical protein [Caballeronia sp. GAWG2-1]